MNRRSSDRVGVISRTRPATDSAGKSNQGGALAVFGGILTVWALAAISDGSQVALLLALLGIGLIVAGLAIRVRN